MMNYRLLLPLVLLLLGSCKSERPNDAFRSLSWLAGTWIQDTADSTGLSCEVWWQEDSLSYSGYGLTMAGTDTLFYEDLRIIQENQDIYYIADPGEGQVRFKLTSRGEKEWMFSNPKHDFPKEILYEKGKNTMTVTIMDEEKKITFSFYQDNHKPLQ